MKTYKIKLKMDITTHAVFEIYVIVDELEDILTLNYKDRKLHECHIISAQYVGIGVA